MEKNKNKSVGGKLDHWKVADEMTDSDHNSISEYILNEHVAGSLGGDTLAAYKQIYDVMFDGYRPDVVFKTLQIVEPNECEGLTIANEDVTTSNAFTHCYDDDIYLGGKLNRGVEAFCIVMPVGSGKSTIAHGRGVENGVELLSVLSELVLFVDIDDIYDFSDVRTAVEAKDWGRSTELQRQEAKRWLNARSLIEKRYIVFLCHSFDQLKGIAKPLSVCLPSSQLYRSRLSTLGGGTRADLAAGNRASAITEAGLHKVPIHYGSDDFDNICNVVSSTINGVLNHEAPMYTKPGGHAYYSTVLPTSDDLISRKLEKSIEEGRACGRLGEHISSLVDYSCIVKLFIKFIRLGEARVGSLLLDLMYHNRHVQLSKNTRISSTVLAKYLVEVDVDLNKIESIMLGCAGSGYQMVASVILYGCSGPPRLEIMLRLANAGVMCRGLKYYTKITKGVHDWTRRSGIVSPDFADIEGISLHDTLYLATLAGRYYSDEVGDDGAVDARAQALTDHTAGGDYSLTNRQRTWNIFFERWLAEFEKRVESALKHIEHRDVRDVLADFIYTSTDGSASGGKQELASVETDGTFTKRDWINMLTEEDLLAIPVMDAQISTTAVLKTELGKLRQLFPGPAWHWMAETVILGKLERHIFQPDPHTILEDKEEVPFIKFMHRAKRSRGMLRSANGKVIQTAAIDYSDFNITHTIKSMQAIYKSISNACFSIRAKDDRGRPNVFGLMHSVCEWLIECLEHMYGRAVGGDGNFMHMIHGLWSGWRSTTFINTTEHEAYTSIAYDMLRQALGEADPAHYQILGDDGDNEVMSLSRGLLFFCAVGEQGHEMNPSKQLLGNRTEFLRVIGDSEGMHGNLARATGAYVCSDLQSNEVKFSAEYVKGCSSAANMMIRRGYDLCAGQILQDVVCMHYAAAFEDQHLVRLTNKRALYIEERNGGFGCNKYGTLNNDKMDCRPKKQVRHTPHINEGQKTNAIDLAVDKAMREFRAVGLDADHADKVRDALVNASFTKSLPSDVREARSDLEQAELVEWIKLLNRSRVIERPIDDDMRSLNDEAVITYALQEFGNLEEFDPIHFTRGTVAFDKLLASCKSSLLRTAAVCPELITEATRGGQKISALEIVNALGTKSETALFAKLVHEYGQDMIEDALHGRFNMYLNNADVIGAELIYLVSVIHTRLIHSWRSEGFLSHSVHNTLLQDRLRACNQYLVDTYISMGLNKQYML